MHHELLAAQQRAAQICLTREHAEARLAHDPLARELFARLTLELANLRAVIREMERRLAK